MDLGSSEVPSNLEILSFNSQIFTAHVCVEGPSKILRVLSVNDTGPIPALVELKIWGRERDNEEITDE